MRSSPRSDSPHRAIEVKSEARHLSTPKSYQDSRNYPTAGRDTFRRGPAAAANYPSYQVSPRGDSMKHSESSEQRNMGDGADMKLPEMKKSAARCRLFIGNIPQDMTDSELKEMCAKFGKVGEVFVNSQRGFAFVRFDKRSTAEEAKDEMDGTVIRGKTLRVRYASHGAAVRVRNLSEYVSNELLYEAFSYFGRVERAVVAVDDRGKSTGEGIVEFDRKPVAQQCIAKCAEGCFLLTNDLKPVVVEALVQVDEDDGLAERSLVKTDNYYKARSQPPRFVQPGSFEHSICVRWVELEEQRRQLETQLKERMMLAKEQLELEIEQALIDHQTFLMREDLVRRQNELRFMEEKRRQELEKRKNMIQMVMQQQQQQSNQQQQQQFNFPRLPNFQMPSIQRLPNPMENLNTNPYPLLAHYLNNSSATGNNSPSSAASSNMQTSTTSSNGQNNLMAAASNLNNARVIPPGLFTTSAFFQNDPAVNPPLQKSCLLPNVKESQQQSQPCREQQPSSNIDTRSSFPPPQRKRSRF